MNTPEFPNHMQQWVCLQCGYNMIGEMPDICPFCGARHDRFMAWDEAEKTYQVTSRPVNAAVSQLLSVPRLGLEHAAYRVETESGAVWIDSPSAFNRTLPAVDAILFTHHHFLGASNQYRKLWNAQIWLHEQDAGHRLATAFDIDHRFRDDFSAYGIQAYHVGGHTPGFTFYIYQDVLFICDYVFLTDSGMQFNPYGPGAATLQQAQRIFDIVSDQALKTVCGYNYLADFADWLPGLKALLPGR
ncbi:MAG: MBL fold metallo-hydrolase [Methylococcales bacterium]|nr:MBL fold metallo-hydrolase [Methylococcales bacterium]